MTSLTTDRCILAGAPATRPAGLSAEASFLRIVQAVQQKERLAASGLGFRRFDPTAPGTHHGGHAQGSVR